MSTKYLGEKFDIHGGGMDLKFPHHEAEIAQAEACCGITPVNYWMHANMLTLNGKKMAKSTGNNILPEELFSGNNDILSKAFAPTVAKFFMYQAHYRSILDFSNDALIGSEKGYLRLMEAYQMTDSLEAGSTSDFDVSAWRQKCYDAMNDDFNSPVLIAHLFDIAKVIHAVSEGNQTMTADDISLVKKTMHDFMFEVMGLEAVGQGGSQDTEKLDKAVSLLIDLRNKARANKDFATSDAIRDQLAEAGIQLKDSKEGTTYSLK